jgi:transcriptional regulator with XRE-family HTH domain
MLDYAELLSKAINESGLKLNKITELIEDIIGSKPTKEYLSRLQNGRIAPASDRMNEALAKVLSVDPLELKAAAYREKIPEDVLEKLKVSTA